MYLNVELFMLKDSHNAKYRIFNLVMNMMIDFLIFLYVYIIGKRYLHEHTYKVNGWL